jgi:polyhydroxybutyrate depolymerase
VPDSHDQNKPFPVIFWFHGWGGNEDEMANSKQVQSLADQHGYILVAPRGLGSGAPDDSFNSWSFSGSSSGLDGDGLNPELPQDTNAICNTSITPDYRYSSCANSAANGCAWTHCQADDVDFVLALVEKVSGELCVDSNNIFASGGSNGGMFAWELGQNKKSAVSFRAIAPIIGLPHRGFLSGPAKEGDMPVLLVTGILDDTVPPGDWEDTTFTTTSNDNDRFFYTGATAITRVWAVAHQCDTSEPAIRYEAGIEQADCRTYCSDQSKWENGWPDVLDCRAVMGHDYGLNWSMGLVMEFFDAHAAGRK